jgi:hypothetical protein
MSVNGERLIEPRRFVETANWKKNAVRTVAPAYLRPSAQGILLEPPADCLEVIEKSVNWEAEKLHGVEGQGPFDEF